MRRINCPAFRLILVFMLGVPLAAPRALVPCCKAGEPTARQVRPSLKRCCCAPVTTVAPCDQARNNFSDDGQPGGSGSGEQAPAGCVNCPAFCCVKMTIARNLMPVFSTIPELPAIFIPTNTFIPTMLCGGIFRPPRA